MGMYLEQVIFRDPSHFCTRKTSTKFRGEEVQSEDSPLIPPGEADSVKGLFFGFDAVIYFFNLY